LHRCFVFLVVVQFELEELGLDFPFEVDLAALNLGARCVFLVPEVALLSLGDAPLSNLELAASLHQALHLELEAVLADMFQSSAVESDEQCPNLCQSLLLLEIFSLESLSV